jgi:hypothetical protein
MEFLRRSKHTIDDLEESKQLSKSRKKDLNKIQRAHDDITSYFQPRVKPLSNIDPNIGQVKQAGSGKNVNNGSKTNYGQTGCDFATFDAQLPDTQYMDEESREQLLLKRSILDRFHKTASVLNGASYRSRRRISERSTTSFCSWSDSLPSPTRYDRLSRPHTWSGTRMSSTPDSVRRSLDESGIFKNTGIERDAHHQGQASADNHHVPSPIPEDFAGLQVRAALEALPVRDPNLLQSRRLCPKETNDNSHLREVNERSCNDSSVILAVNPEVEGRISHLDPRKWLDSSFPVTKNHEPALRERKDASRLSLEQRGDYSPRITNKSLASRKILAQRVYLRLSPTAQPTSGMAPDQTFPVSEIKEGTIHKKKRTVDELDTQGVSKTLARDVLLDTTLQLDDPTKIDPPGRTEKRSLMNTPSNSFTASKKDHQHYLPRHDQFSEFHANPQGRNFVNVESFETSMRSPACKTFLNATAMEDLRTEPTEPTELDNRRPFPKSFEGLPTRGSISSALNMESLRYAGILNSSIIDQPFHQQSLEGRPIDKFGLEHESENTQLNPQASSGNYVTEEALIFDDFNGENYADTGEEYLQDIMDVYVDNTSWVRNEVEEPFNHIIRYQDEAYDLHDDTLGYSYQFEGQNSLFSQSGQRLNPAYGLPGPLVDLNVTNTEEETFVRSFWRPFRHS